MRRSDPVLAPKRFRYLEIIRTVHVPILARRIERMVRIRERDHQEKRLILGGLLGDEGAGPLADIMAGV
jgi:hypothetical protein